MTKMLRGAVVAAALASCIPFVSAHAEVTELKIMAPAAPGGGWDQTARSMQHVLQTDKLVSNVQVLNVPGAGGTIGLAQFVNASKADPHALIVGGYVMVGAIITNKSPVTLSQVTPIARLTGEFEAIAVPANSPLKSMADLVAALKADPAKVSWAGGSAGGTDHIAAGLILKAIGGDPKKLNYIAFSGGGESLASILGGKVTVGISSLSEFDAQAKAGKLRILGVSGAQRLPEAPDVPTFKESGVDVEIQNWRMVAAAPGITPEQKKELSGLVEKMAKSKAWTDMLKQKGWADTYLAGEAFDKQLAIDIANTTTVLKEIGLAQ
ncbi:Bug family tripartite tricarboxylate transporter substrate binding protein [Ancylobacter defluvii]|uniref:C4-dicarboxylate ABC transporter substrate-binding protein n=1 Tax=Ancylobacter defluvii TaxID=1282440 RepID=A0A9W6NCS6_9HYPH|nr:tripartite tricarboxylate transporter substrate binding protein [Ancylobacter defluvii]MBS7586675.1 tripartite tricarboxylate transporter substrate binding protein [Ancylobacter defluvii]GLK85975.1 C4-dicarboxylate ABC transporter substrate-binding protein [Ancylobacter defluvii]